MTDFVYFAVRYGHVQQIAQDLGEAARSTGDEDILIQHARDDVLAALSLLSSPAIVPGNKTSRSQFLVLFQLCLAVPNIVAAPGVQDGGGGDPGAGGDQHGGAAALVQPDPVGVGDHKG